VLDLSFGSHIIAAILCAAVSLAAVAAIFGRNLILCVFLVLPQQFLLIASAIGAVFCVIDGKFADGAVYPRLFIFVDQIYCCASRTDGRLWPFGVSANLPSVDNVLPKLGHLPVNACRNRQ
jgi:hypothetical protein